MAAKGYKSTLAKRRGMQGEGWENLNAFMSLRCVSFPVYGYIFHAADYLEVIFKYTL